MELNLNRQSGVPLYRQVKNLILEKVRTGELSSGYKMPTERELEQLHCQPNTVSAVYKDGEGRLPHLWHSKGTFVGGVANPPIGDYQERVMRYIDLGLEEAMEVGIDLKDFLKMVEFRVTEKVDAIRSTKAVYVECNTEQADYFSAQLKAGTNMECLPLTISELIEMSNETKLKLYNADVIVSTFNHVPEVIEYTKHFGKEVLGVGINPDLNTIVKIARYPVDTKFAFITISEEFRDKVKVSLENAGLGNLNITYSTTEDSAELEALVADGDVVIVSRGEKRSPVCQ